jgi:lipopolysaccharide biosynthesis glycosyltransferase
MKLLVTVRADENIKGYTEITIPSIMEHAKKWGADFKLLSDESICDVGDGKFHYRILELYTLLDEYDRILNLDADIIITDSCPNPFEYIDHDKIGTIYEDKGSRKPHRRALLNEIQSKWGNVNWGGGYINTGFFMVSKKHKDIFKVDDNKLWTGFGFDDVHLGYKINQNNFEVQELPYTFNHMTMFSESWCGNPDRFDSNILHYAGAGVFDRGVPNKLEQIKRDYKQIYG